MGMLDFIWGKKNDPISRAIDDAINHLEEKQYDDAIAVIETRALTRDPENKRALLHLGICHMLKGDIATAEELLSPIARQSHMDSEVAAARIAMEKMKKDKASANG